jgi:hypothetical protein
VLEFSGIGQGLHQNLGDLTSGGERIELVGGANAAYPSIGYNDSHIGSGNRKPQPVSTSRKC